MKKAFTLNELVVVVVIIGLLAGIGYPQFTKAIERAKRVEGVVLLDNVRTSQFRYALSSGSTSDKIKDLDIVIDNLKYFDVKSLKLYKVSISGKDKPIASIKRLGKSYTLYISLNGTITEKKQSQGHLEPIETVELENSL
jgi:prepilin-type N-terminal cleavage/methylation domain-containing protein